MTREEKIAFINTVMNNTRDYMIGKVDKMPESWEGYELRLYITDTVRTSVNYNLNKKGKKYKDYQNHVIVNNL